MALQSVWDRHRVLEGRLTCMLGSSPLLSTPEIIEDENIPQQKTVTLVPKRINASHSQAFVNSINKRNHLLSGHPSRCHQHQPTLSR